MLVRPHFECATSMAMVNVTPGESAGDLTAVRLGSNDPVLNIFKKQQPNFISCGNRDEFNEDTKSQTLTTQIVCVFSWHVVCLKG